MKSHASSPKRVSSPHLIRGVSLIELMIAIALVATILAGVVKLYSDSHRSFLTNQGVSRVQEGIRFAFEHISRNAARAGFTGCVNFTTLADNDALGDTLDVLLSADAGDKGLYDFDKPISGTNNDGLNGSDTLTMRAAKASTGIQVETAMANEQDAIRVDAGQLSNSGLDQGDIAVISDCQSATVFMVTNDTAGGNTIEHTTANIDGQSNTSASFKSTYGDEIRSLAMVYSAEGSVVEYSINTSAAGTAAGGACAAATPQHCALFMNDDELLDGIEDLQVLYGEQTASGGLNYRDAADVADWRAVVSLNVTLTVNSVDVGASLEDDRLVRQTVTKTVMLRNGKLSEG